MVTQTLRNLWRPSTDAIVATIVATIASVLVKQSNALPSLTPGLDILCRQSRARALGAVPAWRCPDCEARSGTMLQQLFFGASKSPTACVCRAAGGRGPRLHSAGRSARKARCVCSRSHASRTSVRAPASIPEGEACRVAREPRVKGPGLHARAHSAELADAACVAPTGVPSIARRLRALRSAGLRSKHQRAGAVTHCALLFPGAFPGHGDLAAGVAPRPRRAVLRRAALGRLQQTRVPGQAAHLEEVQRRQRHPPRAPPSRVPRSCRAPPSRVPRSRHRQGSPGPAARRGSFPGFGPATDDHRKSSVSNRVTVVTLRRVT